MGHIDHLCDCVPGNKHAVDQRQVDSEKNAKKVPIKTYIYK